MWQIISCHHLLVHHYRTILQLFTDEDWHNLIGFTLESQHPVDFRFPNYWNSTAPNSMFVQHRIVALPTPEGRRTLTDMQLKTRRDGAVTTRELADMGEYRQALAAHFGLIIEDDFLPRLV